MWASLMMACGDEETSFDDKAGAFDNDAGEEGCRVFVEELEGVRWEVVWMLCWWWGLKSAFNVRQGCDVGAKLHG